MDINKIFKSKIFRWALIIIGALVVLLFVFKAGMIVGVKKADFSCRWSDNYHRNFGGPRGGFLEGFGDRDFMEANGVFGQIIKIDVSTSTPTSTFVVKGRGDTERVVLLDGNSVVKNLKDTVKSSDLKVGDSVVIIGEPNAAGQIEAKLVRVMPTPPTGGPAPVEAPPHFFPRQ